SSRQPSALAVGAPCATAAPLTSRLACPAASTLTLTPARTFTSRLPPSLTRTRAANSTCGQSAPATTAADPAALAVRKLLPPSAATCQSPLICQPAVLPS